MAVRCLYYNREYDVTLSEFDRSIVCTCGNTVNLKHEKIIDEALIAGRSEEFLAECGPHRLSGYHNVSKICKGERSLPTML